MSDPIELFFRLAGRAAPHPGPARPDCPGDELLAGYLDGVLPEPQRQGVEQHALLCHPCFDVLRTAVDVVGVRPLPATLPARPFRVLAQLRERGLQILNHLELRVWSVSDDAVPALGALRGGESTDLVSILGPGHGLSELELQVDPDGSTRLLVHCDADDELRPGEKASLSLETDGHARARLPLPDEGPLSFTGLGRGTHRVQLTARAPGETARTISEAVVELS